MAEDPRVRQLLKTKRLTRGSSDPKRLDLRGLQVPEPGRLGTVSSGRQEFIKFADSLQLRRHFLSGVDLSGSRLRFLRFFECKLTDCIFDGSDCSHLGIWKSEFVDCSFR